MDDQIRYNRDRATVMAITKYLLFIFIGAAVLFVSSKLIVIVLPFLLGFVIAKASRHIAHGVIRFGNFISRLGRKPKSANASITDPDIPDAPDGDAAQILSADPAFHKNIVKKPRGWIRVLFPAAVKKKRSLKTRVNLIVYAILVILILACLLLSLIALIAQLRKFIGNLPEWVSESNLSDTFDGFVSRFSTENGGFLTPEMTVSVLDYLANLQDTLTANIPSMANSLLRGLFAFIGSLPIMLFFVVVVIMSGVYFITDGKKLLRFFTRNIKSRVFRHKSFRLLDQLSTTLFRVLGGYLSLLIITFFEALAIFYLAKVPYAFILALVTAILDFMPVLGVSATMVPVMIYLLVQGNITGFLIILTGMAIITVVRRVIEPPILGNAMNMHPMATLFAMIIGVAAWGAIGFLVGPIVALIVIETIKVFSFDKKLRDFAETIFNKIGD